MIRSQVGRLTFVLGACRSDITFNHGASVVIDRPCPLQRRLVHTTPLPHDQLSRYISGADVNASDSDGTTALHVAASQDRLSVAVDLLRFGAEVNAFDNTGMAPLHVAALHGHFDMVQRLVADGASITETDRIGMTPLHFAASRGHLRVVQFLMGLKGINVAAETYAGWTAGRLASAQGHKDVANCLKGGTVFQRLINHLSPQGKTNSTNQTSGTHSGSSSGHHTQSPGKRNQSPPPTPTPPSSSKKVLPKKPAAKTTLPPAPRSAGATVLSTHDVDAALLRDACAAV